MCTYDYIRNFPLHSIYIHVFVIVCHHLHACKRIQTNILAMPMFISNQEKTSVPPMTWAMSKHQAIPISPSWPWFLHFGSLPGDSPNKGMLQLVMKWASNNLDLLKIWIWRDMRQFQSNSHQDPEQKLSPSFLAQQGRDWMLFWLSD